MSNSAGHPDSRITLALASLAGLAVLKLMMLAALFSGTPPFPPSHLAPLFAASLALSVLGGGLVYLRSPWLIAAIVPVLAESFVSFGPHKLYPGESPLPTAESPAVVPVIVVGSILVVVLAINSWRVFRSVRADKVSDHGDSGEAAVSDLATSAM